MSTRSSGAAPPRRVDGHGRGGGLSAQRVQPPIRGRTAAAPDVHRDACVNQCQPPSGAGGDHHDLEQSSGPRATSGGRRGTHDKTAHQLHKSDTAREKQAEDELAKPKAPAQRRAPRLRCTPERVYRVCCSPCPGRGARGAHSLGGPRRTGTVL